ncbi:MAG: carbohydrate porin [Myxococcota bacterium]|nr:carbohydrate porin [Myxococcota bacterium]
MIRWPSALVLMLAIAAPTAAQPPDPPAQDGQERATRSFPQINDVETTLDDVEAENVGAADPTGLVYWGPVEVFTRHVWAPARDRLARSLGLRLGASFLWLYQNATNAIGSDESGQYNASVFGRWHILGGLFRPGTGHDGYLNFVVDFRDRKLGVTPLRLAPSVGSLWSTADLFGRWDYEALAYWQQSLFHRKVLVNAGRFLSSSFFDSNRASNSDQYFLNQAFAFNPATTQPRLTIGANVKIQPFELAYLTLGFGDVNGRARRNPFDSFARGEYWYGAELGLTPDFGRFGTGTYRFHGWFSQNGKEIRRRESWGLSLSFDHQLPLGERFFAVPFFRYAYQGKPGTPTQQIVSFGLGAGGLVESRDDVMGIGFSWGEPHGSRGRAQKVLELFYRLQLTETIRVTPDVQVIFDPSEFRRKDTIGIFGIRVRVAI